MTLKEIFQALIDGKKLRLSYWQTNEFLYLQDNQILDETGQDSSFCFYLLLKDSAKAEIYEKPSCGLTLELMEQGWKDIKYLPYKLTAPIFFLTKEGKRYYLYFCADQSQKDKWINELSNNIVAWKYV